MTSHSEPTMECERCGMSLRPAPARFDGEHTTVGYLPCTCAPIAPLNTPGAAFHALEGYPAEDLRDPNIAKGRGRAGRTGPWRHAEAKRCGAWRPLMMPDARELETISKLQVTTPDGRPVWYPGDAILTREDVAALLAVSVRTVQEYPIRVAYPSPTKPRYLFRDVVAFLNSRAA